MKKILLSCFFLTHSACSTVQDHPTGDWSPRSGDVIYHTSKSSQSLAIRIATNSEYSHMGIVFILQGEPHVLEASQPVKYTRLDRFIERGVGQNYAVQRQPSLTPDKAVEMQRYAESHLGKDYDALFAWSDRNMYCSEIVWKSFREAGIIVSETEKFSDFRISNPIVKRIVDERWGQNLNLDQEVISPAGLFSNSSLRTVYTTY